MSPDSVVLFRCRRCKKDRPAEEIDNEGRCERCAHGSNYDSSGRHYELRRREAMRQIVAKVGGCRKCGSRKVNQLTVKFLLSHRKWHRAARASEVALYDAERINSTYEVLCFDDLKHRQREELRRLA